MPPGSGKQTTALSTDLVGRARFSSRAGLTFERADGTFRRSKNATLGYKDTLIPEDYVGRYQRGGIAKRLIEAYPKAAWVDGVEIVEDEDAETDTAFEVAVKSMFSRLGVWERLQRADILASLGNYGVILLGDGNANFEEELKRIKGPDGLIYMTPMSQVKAKVSALVDDKKDKRFGQPLFYQLTLGIGTNVNYAGMPNQMADIGGKVHWTRIIHVAHGLLDNEVYGTPVLEAVWNYLDDLDKIIGGGAEATWKNMDPGRQINVDPDAAWTTEQSTALKNQIEEFDDGLTRWLRTQGIDIKSLSGAVPQIANNADTVVKFVAGTQALPVRILVGSERGELASTQDRDNWFDRVAEYRREFAEPLARAFVDRCIKYGALPTPKKPYKIVWPEEEELSEQDKVKVISAIAAANQAQYNAEQKIVMTGTEMRDKWLGLKPIAPTDQPPLKPAPVLPGAATADANGKPVKLPTPQPASKPSSPQQAAKAAAGAKSSPFQRVISEHGPKVMAAALAAWMSSAHRIDAEQLDHALANKSEAAATRVVMDAVDLDAIAEAATAAYADAGEVTSEELAPRFLGGPGSGNFGHSGRPGEVGGSASAEAQADQIAKMPSAERDNTDFYDRGMASGYKLYEARQMMPKQDGKLKKVTDTNSFMLWKEADGVVNFHGSPLLAHKYEDPDDDEQFVWAFSTPGVQGTAFETSTFDLHEALKEYEAYTARGLADPKPLTTADAITLQFTLTNPRAVLWARQNGSRLITEVSDSIQEAVAKVIKQALSAKLSRQETIDKIKQIVGLRSDQIDTLNKFAETATEKQTERYAQKLLRDRAELIGRTETQRAANAGKRESWMQAIDKGYLPADQKRQWLGNDDGHERPSHIFMNDQVVGVTEDFIDEDGEPLEPGEDPNCRCNQDLFQEDQKALGGAGSGNFGHSGRPGEVGGSGDGRVEAELANLDSLGYSWSGHKVEEISLDKLKVVEEGEKNPNYTEAYKRGDRIPLIAVNSKNEIVDGNKRYFSAKAAGLNKIEVIKLKNFSQWREHGWTRPGA